MDFKYWDSRAVAELTEENNEDTYIESSGVEGSDNADSGSESAGAVGTDNAGTGSESVVAEGTDNAGSGSESVVVEGTDNAGSDSAGSGNNGTEAGSSNDNADSVSETEIVDITEVRRDREENDRFNREVEEYFANGEEQAASEPPRKKKSLPRKIFVDGLLGIPLLIIIYVLAAAFTVAFAALFVALLAVSVVLCVGALTLLPFAIGTLGTSAATGLVFIGAALGVIGIGLILFMLAALTACRLIPGTIKVPFGIEKKLHLFRD